MNDRKVSQNGGETGASTNLKEALCEKIPVYHDLLRNFRRHFGPSVIAHVTINNLYDGLSGVKTVVRETSGVDPVHGIMFRGLTIPEVIALLPRQGDAPSAEAVFWLLLTGDVPTHQQTASLIADWTSRRQKYADWWSGSKGETITSVLRSMPKTVTPLGRLSVALTILNVSEYAREAEKRAAMPHTYWEYVYEDGMEFLAVLPAIIGLIAKGQTLTNVGCGNDWVQFLSECLINANDNSDSVRSVADFLRLYVALNADDDGGGPAVRVTQILGSTSLSIQEVLATSAMMYTDEPASGTMLQWKELQTNIRKALGQTWTGHALTSCVLNLFNKRGKLIGHREAEYCDPRYTALLNYAKQHLPDDTEIKFSQEITRVLRLIMKKPSGRNICPDQSAIAAPIFQFLGLRDMQLNQTILYTARSLGAIASIIWSKVVNAPIEHPVSKSTQGYIESIRDIRRRRYRMDLYKTIKVKDV